MNELSFDTKGQLQKLRPYAFFLSLLAGVISVTYTVLFNVGSAQELHEKILAGFTGFVQDGAEVLLFLLGVWLLSFKERATMFKTIGVVCVITSMSLVLWSIASTWGGTNAMIDKSTSKSLLAQEKFNLIKNTVETNQSIANNLNTNAAAIRDKAGEYGKQQITRSIEKLESANVISHQAISVSNNNLEAVRALDSINLEEAAQVNSAQAAFTRISEATGLPLSTVSTTFLLTRATQLEIIMIVTGLFVMIIPPAQKSSKNLMDSFAEGADAALNRASRQAGAVAAGIASQNAGSGVSRFAPIPKHERTTRTWNMPSTNKAPAFIELPEPLCAQERTADSVTETTAKLMANPNNLVILKGVVEHENFDSAFTDIATGAHRPAVGALSKKYSMGTESVRWLLLIAEYFGVLSAKDTNGQRQLIEALPAQEVTDILSDIKDSILGTNA